VAVQEQDAGEVIGVFADDGEPGGRRRPRAHLARGTRSLGGDAHIAVQYQPSNSKIVGAMNRVGRSGLQMNFHHFASRNQ
jgi:hypothetical protein